MNIDVKKMSCELLIALRGDMARSAVARRIKTSVENITRWESGSRKISWSDFIRISEVSGHPVKRSMQVIFNFHGDYANGSAVLRQIIGAARLSHVAKETNISRHSLMRWQQNKSEPPLIDILRIMHLCQYMMLEFVAHLTDISAVPEAWQHYSSRHEQKKILYEMPVVAAVLCCLRLDEYQALPEHTPGFIASKIDITVEEELLAIEKLLSSGIITLQNGRYATSEDELELSDSDSIKSFSAYWLSRAAQYAKNAENSLMITGFGMEIRPVSRDTLTRLRKEYCKFFQQIRSLLSEDTGSRDSVFLFQSLFFDLDRRFDTKRQECARPPRPRRKDGTAVLRSQKLTQEHFLPTS